MKKNLLLALASAMMLVGFSSASFFGTKPTTYNLPNNSSVGIFFPIKNSNISGTGYMSVLNSRALANVPVNATTAVLTTTLDKAGTVKTNYTKNTYTITVGYTSCKVADYVSRKELPHRVTVDLTNVKCLNKAKPVNFLPLLKKGQRINIFFAKQNGTTHNTSITIQ